MESQIKSIETQYNGYRFRSRLEARWAVFFDAAGIKYEYEPEGFELEDGTRYLPDFYLPELGWYAEVKAPRDGIENDMQKMLKFIGKGIDVLLLLGNIPPKVEIPSWHFHILHYNHLMKTAMCGSAPFVIGCDGRGRFDTDLYIDRTHEIPTWNFDEHDFCVLAFEVYHDRDLFTKYFGGEELAWCETWDKSAIRATAKAFDAARCARFEHGETPTARTRKKRTKA